MWAHWLRRQTVFVALVSTAPLLSNCVSAVDDPAFGFNGTATQNAADGQPGAEAGDAAGNGDKANSAVAAALADTSAPAAPAAAAVDAEADKTGRIMADIPPATAKPAPYPLASGRTAIAAYAGASVGQSSETAQPAEGAAKHADNSLFTSLFAESQTKTPIRNADVGKSRRVILKSEGAPVPVASDGITELASLPGVKSRASLFEIGQRASADYDAEILEEANGDQDSFQVASLSGMARMAPNGLLVQRPDVQTGCFEPKLVAMIRSVEAKFHTKAIVTSGYRSPSYNKRVNGAQKSMHMSCKAADIQVPGANNIAVANYVRSLPGRGGVGTYCHTTAIHVDIGRERDWNWSCTRRRA